MDDGAVCALVLLIPLTDPFLHRLAPLFRGQRIEKAYGFSASPFHNRVKFFLQDYLGFLVHVDFSGAVFTHAHFQKKSNNICFMQFSLQY